MRYAANSSFERTAAFIRSIVDSFTVIIVPSSRFKVYSLSDMAGEHELIQIGCPLDQQTQIKLHVLKRF